MDKCINCSHKVCRCKVNSEKLLSKMKKSYILQCKVKDGRYVFQFRRKQNDVWICLDLKQQNSFKILLPSEYHNYINGAKEIQELCGSKIEHAYLLTDKMVIALKNNGFYMFSDKHHQINAEQFYIERGNYLVENF